MLGKKKKREKGGMPIVKVNWPQSNPMDTKSWDLDLANVLIPTCASCEFNVGRGFAFDVINGYLSSSSSSILGPLCSSNAYKFQHIHNLWCPSICPHPSLHHFLTLLICLLLGLKPRYYLFIAFTFLITISLS